MKKYGKPDANQGEIVKALLQAGCDVLDLKAVGNGCPDLLVSRPYYPHHYFLLEIKDGAKPPSARKLTGDQVKFHARWKAPIYVVTCVDEALNAVGIVRIEERKP